MRRVLFLIMCAFFLAGCVTNKVTFFTPDGYVNIPVRVADSPQEQAKGLMASELAADEGMLFVFPDSQVRAFWMKDTKVSLDIIFVDESRTVTEIKEHLPPCVADPCQVFPSKQPAMFAVEVNAGFARAHRVVVGSRMTSTVT